MRSGTCRGLLLAAGLGTFGIAAAQALMPASRELVQTLGGPSAWSEPMLVAASLAAGALIAYMGACALSLAGVIRPLPLRRAMVIVAALGFSVRGFSLVPQLLAETAYFDPADRANAAQLLVSAVSLVLGALYVAGLAHPESLASTRTGVETTSTRRLVA